MRGHRLLIRSLVCGVVLASPRVITGTQGPPRSAVSAELQAMYEADQADRAAGQLSPERERGRLGRAKALLNADSLVTGPDYYHAAMLFQHSPDRKGRDHLTAPSLAVIAAMKGHEAAPWLAAAALDRFLAFNKMHQFFGTQFQQDSTGRWRPGDVDASRSESLRVLFQIPDREALLKRAASFNR